MRDLLANGAQDSTSFYRALANLIPIANVAAGYQARSFQDMARLLALHHHSHSQISSSADHRGLPINRFLASLSLWHLKLDAQGRSHLSSTANNEMDNVQLGGSG
jgi:hypothetical protein